MTPRKGPAVRAKPLRATPFAPWRTLWTYTTSGDRNTAMAHTGLRVRTFLAHAAHDLSLEFRMLTERLIGKLRDLLRQVDELEAAKVPRIFALYRSRHAG